MTVSYKKSGPGGGSYYTDCMRADGTSRVDDYYSGSAKEPPGRWYVGPAEDGTRSTELGIVSGAAFVVTDDVDDSAAFAALVDGYNPRTGQAMVQNAGKHARIAIHDWTCSAPKSVSVAWSQADAELRAAIDIAQEHGARAFLDVLSSKSYSRRGKDGIVKVAAPLRGAVFDHGSSRENDPQKHTHCVAFNATERTDGTTGAVETLELMRWQGAAASIYHATLAWDLRQLGFQIERRENLFEIAGVPEHVCQAFSQRRQQIVAAVRKEMLARELDPDTVQWSRGLLQKATTETRSAKNELTREQLLELWRERGADLGFTSVEVEALLIEEPVRELSREELLEEARKAVSELSENSAVFREPALLTRVAVNLTGRASPEQIAAALQDVKGELLVTLDEHDREVFTTREMLVIERELLQQAHRKDGEHVLMGLPQPMALDSAEQMEAWHRVTTDANAVSVVEGTAGAGKTYTMNAIARSYESRGYQVTGLALAWSAALNLKDAAKLKDGRAIAGWLKDVEAGKIRVGEKSVLVVDEAGMVGVRDVHRILKLAKEHGAKVILLGDTRQQKAVAAGDPLRKIVQQHGSSRLDVIRRQVRQEDREAVNRFFDGRAKDGLRSYVDRQSVHLATGTEVTQRTMTRDWMKSRAAHAAESHLLIAANKRTVLALNMAAHNARKGHGELGESVLLRTMDCTSKEERVEFSIGDEVVFRANDKERGVFNRTSGVIVRIEQEVLHIATAAGVISMDTTAEKWQRDDGVALQHGYATTAYSSQGLTVDRAFVLDSLSFNRASAGVAMSRHRQDCQVYVDRALRYEAKMKNIPADEWHPIRDYKDDDCLGQVARSWSSEREKVSTLDYSQWRHAGGALWGIEVDIQDEVSLAAIARSHANASSELKRIQDARKFQDGLLPLPFQQARSYVLPKPAPSPVTARVASNRLLDEGVDWKVLEDAREAGFVDFDNDGRLVAYGYRPDGALVHITDGTAASIAPALRHRYPPILRGSSHDHVDVVETGKEALALRTVQEYQRQLGLDSPRSTIVVNANNSDDALRMPHTWPWIRAARFLDRAAASGRDLLQECRALAKRVAAKISADTTSGVVATPADLDPVALESAQLRPGQATTTTVANTGHRHKDGALQAALTGRFIDAPPTTETAAGAEKSPRGVEEVDNQDDDPIRGDTVAPGERVLRQKR